jgi:hypothetical protein
MKYIFIFLLSFAIVFPVTAAKTVNGTVPSFPPLQPPAPNVYPNYGSNIQLTGETINNPGIASTTAAAVKQGENEQSSPGTSNQTAPERDAAKKNGGEAWVFGLVLAGGLAFLWFKRKNIIS